MVKNVSLKLKFVREKKLENQIRISERYSAVRKNLLKNPVGKKYRKAE